MNYKIFTRFCLGLLSILLVNSSFAQVSEPTSLSPVIIVSSNVSQKVINAFQSSFSNPLNQVWYKIGEKYLVKFSDGNLPHHVCYRKNGSLVYNITYANGSALPFQVKKLVNSNYNDYNILAATNVQDNERDVWVIKLEDNNRLISVVVENDDLQEVSKFQKGI